MAVSYRVIFVVVIMIVIIAVANMTIKTGSIKTNEGFDCATETSLLSVKYDTGSYINDVIFLTEKSPITYTEDEIYNIIGMLTKIYDVINNEKMNGEQTYNPFYGVDVVNPPKSCGCKNTISGNFDTYYKEKGYNVSTNRTFYFSFLRFFFDIEDPKQKKVYTGLGDYPGSYNQDYYSMFFKNGAYIVPNEITTPSVYLVNPKFKYHLNYLSKYILINSESVSKDNIMEMIVDAANALKTQYTSINNKNYDTNLNPFPGMRMHSNDLPTIISKARYKTFNDWNNNNVCSGTTLYKNARKILDVITDKKYFVSYLKSVKQAILGRTVVSGSYYDWDPDNKIINDITDMDTMLLTDAYLLSNSADNVYNLMELFGHFDPLSNTYTLNTTGDMVIKQMSVDVKKCVIDYLDRICVLAFVPTQYGGEVNYDRWGFF